MMLEIVLERNSWTKQQARDDAISSDASNCFSSAGSSLSSSLSSVSSEMYNDWRRRPLDPF
eukprot:11671887-Karenia_brevis.AAC.1